MPPLQAGPPPPCDPADKAPGCTSRVRIQLHQGRARRLLPVILILVTAVSVQVQHLRKLSAGLCLSTPQPVLCTTPALARSQVREPALFGGQVGTRVAGLFSSCPVGVHCPLSCCFLLNGTKLRGRPLYRNATVTHSLFACKSRDGLPSPDSGHLSPSPHPCPLTPPDGIWPQARNRHAFALGLWPPKVMPSRVLVTFPCVLCASVSCKQPPAICLGCSKHSPAEHPLHRQLAPCPQTRLPSGKVPEGGITARGFDRMAPAAEPLAS